MDYYEQMMGYVEDLTQINWNTVDRALFAVNHTILHKMIAEYSSLSKSMETAIGGMVVASHRIHSYDQVCIWLGYLDALHQQIASTVNTTRANDVLVAAHDELCKLKEQAIAIESIAFASHVGGKWTDLSCSEHA